MKTKNIKKVYQLWGVNDSTGEEIRLEVYDSKSSAYRARETVQEKDTCNYYYLVKTVTLEEYERQLHEAVPIEKAKQKLKDECHLLIEENGNIICRQFDNIVTDPLYEKNALLSFKKGQKEYTCEILRCPDESKFIESISAFVESSFLPGFYVFGLKMKLREHELANDSGECSYVLSCIETFAGMREHLKLIMEPNQVVCHLKKELTIKIFCKRNNKSDKA